MLGDVAVVAGAHSGMGDTEFAARVGHAVRAGDIKQSVRGRNRWPLWAAAAVALLVPAIFFGHSRGRWYGHEAGTFTARGGESRPTTAEVLLVRDGKLLPLEGRRMRATDAFAVRVRNQGARPTYILAFARDRAGEVHWLYPAYRDGLTNPYAVEIPAGSPTHLLPELVAPEAPAPGAMVVVSVLLDRPTSVKEAEAKLAKSPDPNAAFPGAIVSQWSLTMEPSQ